MQLDCASVITNSVRLADDGVAGVVDDHAHARLANGDQEDVAVWRGHRRDHCLEEGGLVNRDVAGGGRLGVGVAADAVRRPGFDQQQLVCVFGKAQRRLRFQIRKVRRELSE